MSDSGSPPPPPNKPEEAPATEHLNIKVTDNNNEVFFKIKRTTALKKLMDAFCERQGKTPSSVRFLFDGSRVQSTDSPDTVRLSCVAIPQGQADPDADGGGRIVGHARRRHVGGAPGADRRVKRGGKGGKGRSSGGGGIPGGWIFFTTLHSENVFYGQGQYGKKGMQQAQGVIQLE